MSNVPKFGLAILLLLALAAAAVGVWMVFKDVNIIWGAE